MRFAAILVGLLPACAANTPALDPLTARTAGVDLTLAVQVAAEQCTANARHLEQFSSTRSEALYDACVDALTPTRDAIVFLLPSYDQRALGCAGKTIRIGLEKVRDAFAREGYATPQAITLGADIGRRLEAYADERCNPRAPAGSTSTVVDPNIARVEPRYP